MDGDKAKDDDRIRKVIKHGNLEIGFIGLEECLTALTGKNRKEDKITQKLGLKIISFMKNKVEEFCSKYNLNFSLMGTEDDEVAESFIAIDKSIYGNIEGVTDKNMYTNSFYISECDDIIKKIKIEAPYHELTCGGHALKININSETPEKLEEILKTAKENNCGFVRLQ
jgi:ribonucleoside-triphosphate reductase